MTRQRLTEELPSSGSRAGCDHVWQVVENGTPDSGKMMMVCKKDNCGATKLVNKPKMQESKGQKPLLFG